MSPIALHSPGHRSRLSLNRSTQQQLKKSYWCVHLLHNSRIMMYAFCCWTHPVVNTQHTCNCLHSNSNQDNISHGSGKKTVDCWELYVSWLKLWLMMSWQPSPQPFLNLITSVALLWLSPQWLLPVNLLGCQGHKDDRVNLWHQKLPPKDQRQAELAALLTCQKFTSFQRGSNSKSQ